MNQWINIEQILLRQCKPQKLLQWRCIVQAPVVLRTVTTSTIGVPFTNVDYLNQTRDHCLDK